MSSHVRLDELAEDAEGLLEPDRRAEVGRHLQTCATCRESAEALGGVRVLLAAAPAPRMPAAVSTRLAGVLTAESERRATTRSERAPSDRRVKPGLGTFGDHLQGLSKRRFVPVAVAGLLASAAVGFGGYVVSASAGLNEPTATAVALPESGDLGARARDIRDQRDVDPHRFSRAWRCARVVTDGPITGITRIQVGGLPALLVYVGARGAEQAVVVTGCDTGAPAIGSAAPVAR